MYHPVMPIAAAHSVTCMAPAEFRARYRPTGPAGPASAVVG